VSFEDLVNLYPDNVSITFLVVNSGQYPVDIEGATKTATKIAHAMGLNHPRVVYVLVKMKGFNQHIDDRLGPKPQVSEIKSTRNRELIEKLIIKTKCMFTSEKILLVKFINGYAILTYE
jgi:hypothetical protein